MMNPEQVLATLEQKRGEQQARVAEGQHRKRTLDGDLVELDRLWQEFLAVFDVLKNAGVYVGGLTTMHQVVGYVYLTYRQRKPRQKPPDGSFRQIGLELANFFRGGIRMLVTALQGEDGPELRIDEWFEDDEGFPRHREYTFRDSHAAMVHLVSRVAEYELPEPQPINDLWREQRSYPHFLTEEELVAATSWLEPENPTLAAYLRDPKNRVNGVGGFCFRVMLNDAESTLLMSACTALGIGGQRLSDAE